MLEVGIKGYNKLLFIEEFDNNWKSQGKSNPFHEDSALHHKRTTECVKDGIRRWVIRPLTPEEEMLQKDIDKRKNEYVIERNAYVAYKMLKQFTYDDFLEEIENGSEENIYLKDKYNPCDAGDCQCSFLCDKYFNCPRK
jgi:hypothetical protein